MYTPSTFGTGIALGCALLAGAASSVWAQDSAPSLSMSAASAPTLSTPGELWLRFGVLKTHGGDDRERTSLPVRMLYSFTETVGVRIDFEPWVDLTQADGSRVRGTNDPTVLLRVSRALPDAQTVSLEAGAKFAVAKRGLSSGKDDAVFNGIYSREFEKYYVEASFGYSRLGTALPGQSRNQFPWYIDILHSMDDVWGTTFELSGTNQVGTKPIMEMLGALSYRLAPNTIVVGKLAFGLTDRAPHHTVGCNFIVTFK